MFRHIVPALAMLTLAACGQEEEATSPAPEPTLSTLAEPAQPIEDAAVTAWVQTTYGSQTGGIPRFESGRIDLNADGTPEVLVLLTGPDFCGSGGCSLAVLTESAGTFTQIGDLSLVRAPIGAFESRSEGWRDLAVYIAGGGLEDAGMARVPFVDGAYAGNPTVAPAQRSDDPFETAIAEPAEG